MSDEDNSTGSGHHSSDNQSPAPSGNEEEQDQAMMIDVSDIRLQHMRHNAIITAGNEAILAMMRAHEAIQTLPEEERYTKYLEFNNWADAQKDCADNLKEMSMINIIRDNLHIKANVSTKQMKIDNKETLTRIEKVRRMRQKAIDKLSLLWHHSRKGVTFATILIMTYGTRFQYELTKVVKLADPDTLLEVVNGELIRRLTSPPKPGVRVNRHLMPSEFRMAFKVLDPKQELKAFEWDDESRKQLGLKYNMVGMLGEESSDYSEDVPPAGDSHIEFSAIPSPPPNEEVIANLERWSRLGVSVAEEDKEPRQNCLMDKWIVRQAAPLGSEEEAENVEQPESCKCPPEALVSKDWYLALKEKFVAKQIGWMTMAELIPRRPGGLCNFHLRHLANVLGLKTTRVKSEYLVHRLKTVYKRRDRIDDVRIHDKYFAWFKHNEGANKERKKRILGVLKFRPLNPSASEPAFELEPPATLTKVHEVGRRRSLATDPTLTMLMDRCSDSVSASIKMYCHHNRYEKQGLGFAHHCYYAPWQQGCRQDLMLWREVAKQRMDQEYRLVTIPFPALIIQAEEDFDRTFVHGNARDLYTVSDYKMADHITVYVVHSHDKNGENTSQTEVVHGRVKPSALNDTDWRTLAESTLGKGKMIFDHGFFHDITAKRRHQSYTNLTKSDQYMNGRNNSWALVAGGNPTSIRPYMDAYGDEPFAATIVPYTAVKKRNDGTLDPILENGMKYQDLRDAHSNLKPIFDKTVTWDGQHEIPGFAAECHLITENPVEQALVGRLPWDDHSVLIEASRLLEMTDDEFHDWYRRHQKEIWHQHQRAFTDVISKESAYGEKSYYHVVSEEPAAGQKRKYASADEEEGMLGFSTDTSGEDATPPQSPQPPSRAPSPPETRRVKRRRRELTEQDRTLNDERDENEGVTGVMRGGLSNSRGLPGRPRGSRRMREVIPGERRSGRLASRSSQPES
ncbi:hypothetical protein ACHAP3_003733 [Botrytis cinerea]